MHAGKWSQTLSSAVFQAYRRYAESVRRRGKLSWRLSDEFNDVLRVGPRVMAALDEEFHDNARR